MEQSEHWEFSEEGGRRGLRIWGRIIVLGLICAFAGGAVGSAFTTAVQTTGETEAAAETIEISELPVSVPVMQVMDQSGKAMTPQTVFYTYAKSVVAINNETTTNVFGQTAAAASTGSGFILSEDGYLLTNYHVIQNAQKLTAVLHDGTTHAAAVIGSDPDNDLALLKIDAQGLSPVRLGDSSALQVGEVVCAIGNPLGELTNTLTAGYISALDREINTDGAPINMLQTDCAINAGNSGGPLFDMNGEVVAIITAKYYGDTIEGLGFAIPINDAVKIVADLKAHGYVTGRAKLGITALDISGQTAELYSLPVGVYIYAVEAESCAERAGLRERDVITAIGDQPVQTMTELIAALRNYSAGDMTTLKFVRDGTTQTIHLTLDEKLPAPAVTESAQET